jgi:hypothetical protein
MMLFAREGVVRLTGVGVGWLLQFGSVFLVHFRMQIERASERAVGILVFQPRSRFSPVSTSRRDGINRASNLKTGSTSERETKRERRLPQSSARRNFRTTPLAALSSTRHTNKAFRQAASRQALRIATVNE